MSKSFHLKDEESIIRKRIAFHRENTPKVSLFFRQRSIPIHYVNANRTMEEVYQDFKKIINLQHVTKIVTSQPEIPIKVKETVTTHLFGFPSIKTKLIWLSKEIYFFNHKLIFHIKQYHWPCFFESTYL